MLFQPEYGKPKNFINWDKLCRNPNPNAIYILEQHMDKINWANLLGKYLCHSFIGKKFG